MERNGAHSYTGECKAKCRVYYTSYSLCSRYTVFTSPFEKSKRAEQDSISACTRNQKNVWQPRACNKQIITKRIGIRRTYENIENGRIEWRAALVAHTHTQTHANHALWMENYGCDVRIFDVRCLDFGTEYVDTSTAFSTHIQTGQ